MINGILLDQIESNINDIIVSVKQIDIGYVNDVFLMNSMCNRYIVKCFTFSNKEKIDLSIALQKYLSEKELAPKVILEGTCGMPYIVQQYADNEMINKDWFLFGKTLALIHHYFNQFNSIAVKDFSFRQSSIIPCSKGITQEAEELILLKKKIEQKIHLPEIEEKQIIHGDYTWNNVLKNGTKYLTIDFDEAKKYYTIYDVAKVIFDQIFRCANGWANINKFIKGYQNICPIKSDEKREFMNIYAYTVMKDCSGLEDKPNKDVHYIRKRIDKHKKIIQFLDERYEITRRLEW